MASLKTLFTGAEESADEKAAKKAQLSSIASQRREQKRLAIKQQSVASAARIKAGGRGLLTAPRAAPTTSPSASA